MGWDYYHADFYDKAGRVDRKAECERIFKEFSAKVLKGALVGSTYYAAVEVETKEGSRKVVGYVVLTHVNKNYYNFGCKLMSEDMGPRCCDCPKMILDMLTPTDSEWANKWRDDCRKQLKRKKMLRSVKIGDAIEFVADRNTTAANKGDIVRLVRTVLRGKRNAVWFDGRYKWHQEFIPEEFTVVHTI